MTSRPGFRAALVVAVLLVAACGSTPSAGAPTASAGAPATAAPSAPVASQATSAPVAPSAAQATAGAGASPAATGGTGVPALIDGSWTKGVAHVEVTGGRTLTVEGIGSAFSIGGVTSVNFTDEAHTYVIAMTISDNEESSGVAISAQNLITGGTFGKDCQVTLTRNEPAELAGTFSCTNVDAADPTAGQAFKVNIQGTFSAKP